MDINPTIGHLLHAIESHQINVSQDEVQQAFEDVACQELATWLQERLSHETLLTIEEAALYSKLEHGGVARRLQATPGFDVLKPVGDEEIHHALLALETSTSAIEEQNSNLRAQYDALLAFQKIRLNRETETKRVTTRSQRTRQKALQSLDLALEELSKEVNETLDELRSRAHDRETSLPRIIEESGTRDDDEFSNIENIIRLLHYDDGHEVLDQKDKFCAALAAFSMDSIKCRLARIYLTAVLSAQECNNAPSIGQDGSEADLKSEIDSLYDEIMPVAKMAIEHEFGFPLMAAVYERRTQLETKIMASWNQALRSTTNMLNKAELLKVKLMNHDSNIIALNCIFDQLMDVMNESPNKSLITTSLNAPHHVASNGKAVIPGSDISSQGDSAIVSNGESSPAMRQLHVMFGVVSNYEPSHDRLDRRLNASVVDQEYRLEQRSSEAEISSLSTIQAATESVSDAQQLLMDALLVDTVHARVNMTKPDLQSRKGHLQTKVERVGSGLSNLDPNKTQDETIKRESFVDRWNAE